MIILCSFFQGKSRHPILKADGSPDVSSPDPQPMSEATQKPPPAPIPYTPLKWSMSGVYGMGAGEVFWAASDIGWVVGHSYIVYAPLLKGCTTILYEGKPVGTPDPGAFWRLIAEHGVNALFTAPTAFRAIKKEDPQGTHMAKYDLGRFRTLFLAGER